MSVDIYGGITPVRELDAFKDGRKLEGLTVVAAVPRAAAYLLSV